MQSEQINELAAALAKAQGEMKNAAFDAKNPHFGNRYATLAAILDVVRPALSKNGIAVVQAKEFNGTGLHLVTRFIHTSGQWLGDVHPLPDPTTVKPQEFGSQLTYAKRYSLSTLAGVSADEDDDAEIAQKAQTATQKYGTTPKDLVDIRYPIEFDQYGNPIDCIPRGDEGIQQLSKSDALSRPRNKAVSAAISNAKTLKDLQKVGDAIRNDVESFPGDWREIALRLFRRKQEELGWEPELKPKDAGEPYEVELSDPPNWQVFGSFMIAMAATARWKDWDDANHNNYARMQNEDPKTFDEMIAKIKEARAKNVHLRSRN